MSERMAVNVDLARVYADPAGKDYVRTLAWGDYVDVIRVTASHVEVGFTKFLRQPDGSLKPSVTSGFIKPTKSSKLAPADCVVPLAQSKVLKVNFVDVQQGDGTVIETPQGKVVLVDGGDNQLFARYLAGRFRGSSNEAPREIDCIVVTHGDADHFVGLTNIHASETHKVGWKRLFIRPRRIYHNGLVKRPSSLPEEKMLGESVKTDDGLVIVGLETDLTKVPDAQMNKPFREWKNALEAFAKRGPIEFRRLRRGDDDAFAFLRAEGVKVEVLGPIVTKAGEREGLKFLGDPPRGPRLGHEALSRDTTGFGGISASHTINGHSIVLRVVYGNVSFLLTGDLNNQAERILLQAHRSGRRKLRSEVLKAPHHGSADFSAAFLEAVNPLVSVVSSGDEEARKEYIHPRATLVGALGRYSRGAEPLIFITELVAFFQVEGYVYPEAHVMKEGKAVVQDGVALLHPRAKKRFFAFSRAAFGIVKSRTDGKRLLVYTNSGQADLKEAYAFEVDEKGNHTPSTVRVA